MDESNIKELTTSLIAYRKLYKELLILIKTDSSTYKKVIIMRIEYIKRKIEETSELLEKYKSDIREEKLNQLGI